jgi:hypothetical protein
MYFSVTLALKALKLCKFFEFSLLISIIMCTFVPLKSKSYYQPFKKEDDKN